MVSCYLAQKVKLDFLCADRTFSCVSDVAHYSISKWVKPILRIFGSNLDIWSPKNY
jgi:hypothetical protein